LGGMIAMGLGIVSPSLLAGVILNDIGPDISLNGFKQLCSYLRSQKTYSDWQEVVKNLKSFFPDLGLNPYSNWIEIAKKNHCVTGDGTITRDWDQNIDGLINRVDLKKIDLWPLFRSLKRIPLVTLRAEFSNILSEGTLEKMRQQVPAMRTFVIPGVGHAPSLMEPLSKNVLTNFFSEVDNHYL